ncbi:MULTISPECIES: tRNA(Met) cytidine acetyltransferase TmcA [unclassified Archaeoglobus]|jgi:tRNA(Met) cytidine acetyltransferase|uniref:tRNA(Met) cytidine acetyltransferase TmcA n=1 Tax=unclassified Archaeoglobus TaxID=2643606 RepID=UPI0025C52DA4|nr:MULTISPECIES: tRNA(Met) cytidine acetyltransferase TmcA [unclassified Archaeoglobus]
MTVRELLAEISRATEIAAENRHRFMVVLCSDKLDDRVMKIAKRVYKRWKRKQEGETLLIAGRSDFLEISRRYFEGEFLHYKDSPKVLGQTYSSLIIDFTEGFHPNDLGIIVETIKESGIIIAISPPLTRWENFRSRWHEELVSEPYTVDDVKGRFFARFMRRTLKAEGIIVFDADRRKIIKPYEFEPKDVSREEIVIPEDIEIKRKLYKLCATQDQVRVLQVFERLFEREKERKAVVITADRGRGKTAILGIATPYIISRMQRLLKRPARIMVVAPTPQSVQTYFKFLLKAMVRQGMTKYFAKETNGMITVVNSKYARVEYVVPRRAMLEKDFADVVIVDEAAGIDVPVLLKITEGMRYVIFSTTIHGYEGTGRGFSIRFLKRLEKDDSVEINRIHMEEPIRYGRGDPIEKWLYDVLLLDAQPAELDDKDIEAIREGKLEFREISKDELAGDERLLREFFGIYVLAHYRNRPSDLAILLDMPNHLPFIVTVNGKPVCSLHVAVEGNLDEETIDKIRDGYKPKGQIIPDLMLKHYWHFDFPKMVGARVVRIATHPEAMDMGIGSFALAKIVEWAFGRGMDWVGSGFGVSPELLRFWIRNSFTPVHITPQRNEVSGEHTVIVLKALKPDVESIVEMLNAEFTRRLIEYLADELSDLETETAALLLKSLRRDFDLPLPEFGKVERRRMSKYFQGMSLYEYVSDIIRPLVRYYYSRTDKDELEDVEVQVLIGKCLQLKHWKDLPGEGFKKYRTLLNAVKKVWRWYYGED